MFYLSKSCRIEFSSSFFFPIRTVDIIRSINDEDYEKAQFLPSEWEQFTSRIPSLLRSEANLRQSDASLYCSVIDDSIVDILSPLETTTQIWERCEYLSSRFAAKFLPYRSLDNHLEFVLAIRNYEVDGFNRVYPTYSGINLSHDELECLSEQKSNVQKKINDLLHSTPKASSILTGTE